LFLNPGGVACWLGLQTIRSSYSPETGHPLRGSEPKRLGVDGCYKQATPYGVYAYTRKPTLSSQAKDVGNDKASSPGFSIAGFHPGRES